MWTLSGEKLGSLRQASSSACVCELPHLTRAPPSHLRSGPLLCVGRRRAEWRFRVDVAARRAKQLDEADEMLRSLESRARCRPLHATSLCAS